jgi:uncharacterized phiE125 gp8 family phage protein
MLIDVRVVTPPEEEPISLADAKAHLRVTHDAEDDVISALIAAAREYAEGYQGRGLVTQTWEAVFDRWPFRGLGPGDPIVLPGGRLASVTSVKYTDPDGAEGTMDPGDYVVDTLREPGRVYLAYGANWPSLRAVPNAVRVRYVVGADAADVPLATRQGMLLLIGHWYANREAVAVGTIANEMPVGARPLLDVHRLRTGAA